MHSIALAWLLIIGFGFTMYVILDGFTLGIGIISPLLSLAERDLAMSAVLPVWDGNQTWLVFSLAALYGMFPGAFSLLLPKIYLPAICLALLLLFRGICFEFRLKTKKGIKFFDGLFAIASILIALIHGYMSGQVIIGYTQPHFNSQGLPLKIIVAITMVFGYSMLGATRLMLKSEGDLFQRARRIALFSTRLLALFAVMTFLLTLRQHMALLDNKLAIFITIGTVVVIIYAIQQLMIMRQMHLTPYWLGVLTFVLVFFSLGTYIFPYMVPYQLTYIQAAASPVTLRFTLIIAIIMIPLLLAYTFYNYFVFRGKVREKLHY